VRRGGEGDVKYLKILLLTVVMLVMLPNQKALERAQLLWTKHCTGCLLSWEEFVGVDLSGADLQNTNFREAIFIDVDFSGADLRGAEFQNAYFEAVSMKDTNLCGATMIDGQKSSIGCWNSQ
jgi:uncharacterized protein YjbI with pentapeptide repeats